MYMDRLMDRARAMRVEKDRWRTERSRAQWWWDGPFIGPTHIWWHLVVTLDVSRPLVAGQQSHLHNTVLPGPKTYKGMSMAAGEMASQYTQGTLMLVGTLMGQTGCGLIGR